MLPAVTHLYVMHRRVMLLHVMRHRVLLLHVTPRPAMPRRKCAPPSSIRVGEIFVISPFLNEIIPNTP